MVCVFVFVSGMEAWKGLKRYMGWFEAEETEGMKARRGGERTFTETRLLHHGQKLYQEQVRGEEHR